MEVPRDLSFQLCVSLFHVVVKIPSVVPHPWQEVPRATLIHMYVLQEAPRATLIHATHVREAPRATLTRSP